MITRVLQPSRTSAKVLDYNEEKVLRGDAVLVHSRNLPDASMAAVYDTFGRMEENPAVSERTRATSFHMTVGPVPEDGMDEEAVLRYVDDVMAELGYGGQPYVVYRHNDIDREHYHVASVRVRPDGSVISREHEGRRVLEIQRRLAPKYGFAVGRKPLAEGEASGLVPVADAFRQGDPNAMHTLTGLFMKGLQYEFHSLYQFSCIMRAMNVRMTMHPRRDGGQNVVLRGLDEGGRSCTRPVSLERHLKVQGADLYRQRLEQNNALGLLKSSRKEQLMEMSDYCLENSSSEAEYGSHLRELGVVPFVLRDGEGGELRRVTLVERRNKAIVDTALSGELFLPAFREAERSGRWTAPPARTTQPGTAAGVPAPRKPFFDGRRSRELNARIERRLTAFAGKPVPRRTWTGPKLK